MNNERCQQASRVTRVGMVINVALTLFKFFAGFTGRSAAMIADAVHSLSDFATDIVVLIGFKIVKKPVDKSHDYGHGKAETLTAMIIGLALAVVGLRLFWTGSVRVFDFFRGEPIARPGLIALYAAIISIIVKEWLFRYNRKVGRAIDSQAVIANAWHHRSDAFSSFATLVGIGGAIVLGESWRVLDPVASVAVSFFIIQTSVMVSKNSFRELMEVSLSDEFEGKILGIIKSVPGVISPHELKTRRIGNYIAIDVNIYVDKNINITAAHEIATKVENKIKDEIGKETFVSVHVEPCS